MHEENTSCNMTNCGGRCRYPGCQPIRQCPRCHSVHPDAYISALGCDCAADCHPWHEGGWVPVKIAANADDPYQDVRNALRAVWSAREQLDEELWGDVRDELKSAERHLMYAAGYLEQAFEENEEIA